MKAFAKTSDKNTSSAVAARQQPDSSTLLLRQKTKDNEVDTLSRIISSGTPVNSCSGPPDDSITSSQTAGYERGEYVANLSWQAAGNTPVGDSNINSRKTQLAGLIQRGKIQKKLTIGKPDDKYE